jgi:hypothetical protein
VITILQQLVSDTFGYVEQVEGDDGTICSQLVKMAHSHVVKILDMFGLTIFDTEGRTSKETDLIRVVSDIRTDLRNVAKNAMKMARTHKSDPEVGGDFRSVATSLYELTDEIRDRKLKKIGVELTDK